MKKIRNKRRSHAEMLCLSISALYSKQRDHQTLRAARLLRMTDEMSFRSVSTSVIPQCLYAGYRSFLLRPILRIQTLRNDEAAGVRGFTLVELLVVVLIIGILSAIAIPMYQGAVDKSHWSTMLPASKAIKDAEEAIKMTNGYYTPNMDDLDVRMNSTDLDFVLDIKDSLSEPNVIRVTNSKLGDRVRLASYLDDSPKFAGQLHCEAKTGDERSTKLCEKLLGGQELSTVGDYTGYLLDQAVDKATCENADRFFGQKTNTCYKTNAERCTGLGMPYDASTTVCGYTTGTRYEAGPDNVHLEEGGICRGSRYNLGGCSDSTFSNGAICDSRGNGSCHNSSFTNGAVCISGSYACTDGDMVFDNSLCISHGFYGGCRGTQLNNGSVCYAGDDVHVSYGCASVTYNDTSCCCGAASCPDKYRCSPERCAAVERQVQEINAQLKDLP